MEPLFTLSHLCLSAARPRASSDDLPPWGIYGLSLSALRGSHSCHVDGLQFQPRAIERRSAIEPRYHRTDGVSCRVGGRQNPDGSGGLRDRPNRSRVPGGRALPDRYRPDTWFVRSCRSHSGEAESARWPNPGISHRARAWHCGSDCYGGRPHRVQTGHRGHHPTAAGFISRRGSYRVERPPSAVRCIAQSDLGRVNRRLFTIQSEGFPERKGDIWDPYLRQPHYF